MRRAPINLIKYDFDKIYFEVFPDNKAPQGQFSHNVDISVNNDDPRLWCVALSITNEKCPGEKIAFFFKVTGYFKIIESVPDNKIENLVRINAPALLYSAIREMVMNLSLRTLSGALMLPTVNFVDEAIPSPTEAPAKQIEAKVEPVLPATKKKVAKKKAVTKK